MKKMRKLIPALSMLMVAAIMLTTASFAWFTMNENVTATGMEIKAKASGALIISDAPLTYTGAGPSVSLKDAAVNELTQITLKKENGKGVWKEPAADVDQVTGIVDGDALQNVDGLTDAAFIAAGLKNQYFFDKEVYIATAGDAQSNHVLELTMTAPVSAAGTATNAYAIAVYVLGVYEDADVAAVTHAALNLAPNAIVYVDNSLENGTNRNTATIDLTALDLEIPSIVGVGEQGSEKVTGLKIVLRMFVDGDLAYTTTTPVTTQVPVKSGEDEYDSVYDPDKEYFVMNGDKEERAVYYDGILDEDNNVPEDWYYYEDSTEDVYVKYVNNKNIPSNGSTLQLDIKAVEKTPAAGE